jgi:hypothetical protein
MLTSVLVKLGLAIFSALPIERILAALLNKWIGKLEGAKVDAAVDIAAKAGKTAEHLAELSALFSDISRFVNPYPTATDRGMFSERATVFPADPADWPLVGPYDFVLRTPNTDIANVEVVYADGASVYDFVIRSSDSDFTTTSP